MEKPRAQVVRLRTRENAGAHGMVAFDEAAGHGEQQGKMDVGGRLDRERRHHRHRNAPRSRFLHIDIVGGDRHRRYGA